MAGRRTAPCLIDNPRQIAALASPARQEVVDAAVASGAFTIAQLARRLGRPADALYFHVRHLERVGLLRRVGERGNGRERAAVYDLPGRPVSLRYGAPALRSRRVGPVVDGILRLARRDVRRALGRPDTVVEGPARDLWGARARGWLDRRELERANRLLAQLLLLVNSGAPRAGATPVALVFALTPLEAQPESRRKARSRGKSLVKGARS